ncbi:hypothetical protein JCM6882_006844 [Rhodosporidiobolus microsporus]
MLVLSKSLALASLASIAAARPQLAAREKGAVRGDNRMPEDYNPYDGGKKAPEVNFPSGLSRDIATHRVHSHNDYWRETPLYSSLSHGILSVEADVWLNPKDGKLYVAHNVASLTESRTFKHLYVDQLVKVLERANVKDEEAEFFDQTDYYSQTNVREVPRARYTPFFDGSSEPIQVLVDIKSHGLDTFDVIVKELEPLRERDWLTKWNGTHIVPGPVKIILTGNGNNPEVRALVAPKTERDYFIDAPLFRLNETWTGVDGQEYTFNSTLSPLASASYSSLTTWKGLTPINETEQARIQAVIDEVHAQGQETRFWSPPRWPVFAREEIWKTLLQVGSDWLDADDIAEAAAF